MGRRTVRGKGPMLAKLETTLPVGDGWTYEPKWDGFRCLVTVDGEVSFVSRDDRPMMRFFPEVAEMLEGFEAGTFVADGELVLIRDGGALSFDELQLRLHPAASRVKKLSAEIPATLFLFDLLQEGDQDLKQRPLSERRERLAKIAARIGAEPVPEEPGVLRPGPETRLTPWTSDVAVAKRWYADEGWLGEDGILAKRDDQTYQPGVRGWVKVKHRRTTDCVVGGYRLSKGGDGVGSLLLGLYDDDGNLHYVGHTSSFKAAERRQLLEQLAPLAGGAGFGGEARAPGGQSRWSAGRESSWVSLDPILVCEVTYERVQSGRFRHYATFVRWRDDRDPHSCTFEQIGAEPPPWWGDEG
jgi:ATP-dependent DNA ligase